MINLFSIPFILLYAVLFGATMKIADLLDEHGLKWFKGSTILFGILWGGFGALLILSNNLMANLFMALLLQWILRYRIDYLNHGIGTAIMIIAFIALPNFAVDWLLFLGIFVIFSVFGLLDDAADRGQIKGCAGKMFKLNLHRYIVPLFLILINTSYLLILPVIYLHFIFYIITGYYGMKIKRQKP